MEHNSQNDDFQVVDIDWKAIVKHLIDSKKVIIISTIFFTIVAYYLASIKPIIITSSVLVEMGQYDPENNQKYPLVEDRKRMVNDLRINFKLKNEFTKNSNMSFSLRGDGLIFIKSTSSSAQKNSAAINSVYTYIVNRYKDLSLSKYKKREDELVINLDQLKAEIKFNKKQLLSTVQYKKIELIESISDIQNLIDIQKTKLLSKKFELVESISNIQNLNDVQDYKKLYEADLQKAKLLSEQIRK